MSDHPSPNGGSAHPRTLTASWSGLDESTGGGSPLIGRSGGGYRVVQLIGRGGMGLVYEAEHEATGARVALKMLHGMRPDARERLTREFRKLTSVHHPNLIELYELKGDADETFFTMQRIEGEPLVSGLNAVAATPEALAAGVELAFSQLASALLLLHSRGIVHLDLKPDNVLIDSSGHVTVLDFGLAAQIESIASTTTRMAGTPAYMAPELSDGEAPTAASDWYAFGVMLHEAIVGHRPGQPGNAPSTFTVRAELRDLCQALLEQRPADRAGSEDVARVLGLEHPPAAAARTQLVGRDAELAMLRQMLERARGGEPGWIELVGESGIGKSALLDAFLEGARRDPNVVVLDGACYEREATPYKGIDGVLEQVGRALASAPAGIVSPGDIALAATVFRPLTPGAPAQPQPREEVSRRSVLESIRNIIASMSDHWPIVIAIDDVQWGNGDGGHVLAELLCDPTPSSLLVVTARRPTVEESGSFLRVVAETLESRGTTAQRHEVVLDRLTTSGSIALLRGAAPDLSQDRLDAVLDAAEGLPFLLQAFGQAQVGDSVTTLEALVARIVADAPVAGVQLLRAISVCGAPLVQQVAFEQTSSGPAALEELRRRSLVRTVGSAPDGPLEPYHSLLTDAVVAAMTSEDVRQILMGIARSLESKNLGSSEQLADLFHRAGELSAAGRHALAAAVAAEASFAFEGAASWYGRARQWSAPNDIQLLIARARCLERAGRATEAADCYQRAAASTPAQPAELTRAAGSAWLSAGHVDRGLAALTPELRALGIAVPATERAAMFRILRLLPGLLRRGTGFEPVDAPQCDVGELSAIDAAWNAAKGIGIVMVMRGLAFHLEALRLALRTGEPMRVARSIAALSPILCGGPLDRVGQRLLRRSEEIASTQSSDFLDGTILVSRALAMQTRWESPQAIFDTSDAALAKFRASPDATGWEEALAAGLRVRAAKYLGRFDVVAEDTRAWLAEATDRGDLFGQTLAGQLHALSQLAAGDLDAARHYAHGSLARWAQQDYTVQHYVADRIEAHCHLYVGAWDAAQRLLDERWRTLERAQMLRIPISAVELHLLRGITETNLLWIGRGRRSVATKSIEALARWPSGGIKAHAWMLQAAHDAMAGYPARATSKLRDAEQAYEQHSMHVMAACCGVRRAQLGDDEPASSAAVARLRAMGVADPIRYINLHSPLLRRK